MPKFVLLALTGLTSCGYSTGAVPIGINTYAVSEMRAPALGGGPEAYRVVLETANATCRPQGRTVRVLEMRPGGDPRTHYWPTAFDATFQCVDAGDQGRNSSAAASMMASESSRYSR